MERFAPLLLWLARLAGAAVLSLLLFTGVALIHGTIGIGKKKIEGQARRIVAADIIRKPPEERRSAAQQRLRSVSRSLEGKAGEGRMATRFAPDLAVEASGAGSGGAVLQKQDLAAEVFDQGQVDEPASPTYRPPVAYPERARERGIQGTLEVLFIVNHQGAVTDLQVVRSPSQEFTNEARRTIATWRFKPAKNKGIPVNQRVRQLFEFNQNEEP
jgi:TonB family protein